MGNHDDRAALREHLLHEAPTMAPMDRVHDIAGLRVIVLDTSVPGHHHGEIAPEQLQWLAAQLAEPAPFGTILAMHHPPIPSVQDLAVMVELRDQAPVAEVLRGTDVRSILAGHLHYSTTATFAGIPVSVASASCYTQDLLTAGTRGRDGAQAFNLVHCYPETLVHTVIPLAAGPTASRRRPGARLRAGRTRRLSREHPAGQSDTARRAAPRTHLGEARTRIDARDRLPSNRIRARSRARPDRAAAGLQDDTIELVGPGKYARLAGEF